MLYKVTLTIPRTSGIDGRKLKPRLRGFVVQALNFSDAVQTLIKEQPDLFNPEGITHTVDHYYSNVVALP